MREAEDRILSIEWNIFLRRSNSRIAPRQIKGQLAHWLSSINVEYNIKERIRTSTVVSHDDFRGLDNLRDGGGSLEVNVDDGWNCVVDGCLASLFCRVKFERTGVLDKQLVRYLNESCL